MLTLLGVLVVIVGFALRFNALLVVTVAGIVTGLAGGLSLHDVIAAFGKAFTENRYVAIVWMVLPVIGLLERSGLKERARELISRIHAATTGRVLMVYMALRQITSALGLTSLGGHAQMVRPLIAPMAEGAAENRFGDLPMPTRFLIRAHAAASDNVGVFFGEDIFIAIGSILLITRIPGPERHRRPTHDAGQVVGAHGAMRVRDSRSAAGDAGPAAGARGSPGGRAMITLTFVYVLMGLMFAGIAIVNLLDRADPKRYNKAAFWGIYAITFLLGGVSPTSPAAASSSAWCWSRASAGWGAARRNDHARGARRQRASGGATGCSSRRCSSPP